MRSAGAAGRGAQFPRRRAGAAQRRSSGSACAPARGHPAPPLGSQRRGQIWPRYVAGRVPLRLRLGPPPPVQPSRGGGGCAPTSSRGSKKAPGPFALHAALSSANPDGKLNQRWGFFFGVVFEKEMLSYGIFGPKNNFFLRVETINL